MTRAERVPKKIDDGTDFCKSHDVYAYTVGSGMGWISDELFMLDNDSLDENDLFLTMYALGSIEEHSHSYDYVCISRNMSVEFPDYYDDGTSNVEEGILITGGHEENGKYIIDDYFFTYGLDSSTCKIDSSGNILESYSIFVVEVQEYKSIARLKKRAILLY